MAKRKIIWSETARKRLFEILEYYFNRNNSKSYSNKLYKQISKEVRLLIKYPELGIKTSDRASRGLIIGDYIVYYEIIDNLIFIETIRDSRQEQVNIHTSNSQ